MPDDRDCGPATAEIVSRRSIIALAVAAALIVAPLAYAANPLYSGGLDRYAVTGPTSAPWPGRFATAITPSDTLAVAIGPAGEYAKSLYVGVTGNLTVITGGDNSNSGLGTPVLFSNVPVGWFPLQVRGVMATGTTATGIVGVAD